MYTPYKVEIFHEYNRIAIHKRLQSPYKYTTDKEHLPASHRFVAELEPDRLLTQAEEIHKDVRFYISKILNGPFHGDQAIRICVGILSFSKRFGNERLTKACQRAVDFGIYNYRTIKKILVNGLDKEVVDEPNTENVDMPKHDNIRGSDYYK